MLTNAKRQNKLKEKKSRKKSPVQNNMQIDSMQKLDFDIKQEIEEEHLTEETFPLSNMNNSMVWIPSLNLPPIHKPDEPKQDVTANKSSSFDEKTEEKENLEPNKINIPHTCDMESSMNQPEIFMKLNPNLSDMVNHENPIANPSLVSPNNNKQNFKPRITDLMTDEQKQIIEEYYKVDMNVVDKEKVRNNIIIWEKTNIQCNICSSRYSRYDKCEVHIWAHLNMKPYQCKACNFVTVTLSNMRCHIRKCHLKLKLYPCTQCEKRYASFVLLQEHMNTHTGARPFKCQECNFASSSRQILNNHKDTHKLNENLPCPFCNKNFSSRVKLRVHKRIHNKDRIKCEFCHVYLSSEKTLEAHRKIVHSQVHNCNVCSKILKSKKALNNHMNTHAEAKYKCKTCFNVYKNKYILLEHMLKHKGIRKYNCFICGKNFAQMSHLAAHKKVHNPPSYKCEGCKKEFNRRDNMKVHMKRCTILNYAI